MTANARDTRPDSPSTSVSGHCRPQIGSLLRVMAAACVSPIPLCVRNLAIATLVGITGLLVGGPVVALIAVISVTPIVLAFLPIAPAKLYGGLTRMSPPGA